MFSLFNAAVHKQQLREIDQPRGLTKDDFYTNYSYYHLEKITHYHFARSIYLSAFHNVLLQWLTAWASLTFPSKSVYYVDAYNGRWSFSAIVPTRCVSVVIAYPVKQPHIFVFSLSCDRAGTIAFIAVVIDSLAQL